MAVGALGTGCRDDAVVEEPGSPPAVVPAPAPGSTPGYDPMARLRGPLQPVAGGGAVTADLPAGHGSVLVRSTCGLCHSLKMVVQQRLSRRRWSSVLDEMTSQHGMTALEPAGRALILDYLSQHLAPDSDG